MATTFLEAAHRTSAMESHSKEGEEKSWHFDGVTKQAVDMQGKEYALVPASAIRFFCVSQ